MNLSREDRLEHAVRLRARDLAYPPTPDVSTAVRAALAGRQPTPRIPLSGGAASRRLTSPGYGAAVEGPTGSTVEGPSPWPRALPLLRAAALLTVILAAVILAVPDARALISGWFRIGAINIIPSAPSSPVTATPFARADLPRSLRDLAGLTTLEQAQQHSAFRIQLPAYPHDLGDPDLVFHQPRLDLVVLVWLEPNHSDAVRFSLFELLSSNPVVNKIDPTVLAETSVNGHPALWLEGPYPLEVRSGEFIWTRIVEGRSLVWESDGVTYRLESLLSLDESLKIAESIR